MIRVVLFAFVAARVQFDPGGPRFVTTLAYRTPDPALPQLDVIQLCPSSSGSGLLTLLSSACAGMLISPVSALLLLILEPLRDTNWEHAKGHYMVMHVCGVGTQKAFMLQ